MYSKSFSCKNENNKKRTFYIRPGLSNYYTYDFKIHEQLTLF